MEFNRLLGLVVESFVHRHLVVVGAAIQSHSRTERVICIRSHSALVTEASENRSFASSQNSLYILSEKAQHENPAKTVQIHIITDFNLFNQFASFLIPTVFLPEKIQNIIIGVFILQRVVQVLVPEFFLGLDRRSYLGVILIQLRISQRIFFLDIRAIIEVRLLLFIQIHRRTIIIRIRHIDHDSIAEMRIQQIQSIVQQS